MKIIELDILHLFEGVSQDELVDRVNKRIRAERREDLMKKMHELYQMHKDKESIEGIAFEISKWLGGRIAPRELLKMYKERFANEVMELSEDEDEIDYSRKLAPVAKKLFQQAYPGVKVSTRMTSEGFLEIKTSDERFRFSISVNHQYGDNIISVGDAYSGDYRGIVGKLIKVGVDILKKMHPEAEITLIPQHDVSENVWQYIANKLGIGYENNSWY